MKTRFGSLSVWVGIYRSGEWGVGTEYTTALGISDGDWRGLFGPVC